MYLWCGNMVCWGNFTHISKLKLKWLSLGLGNKDLGHAFKQNNCQTVQSFLDLIPPDLLPTQAPLYNNIPLSFPPLLWSKWPRPRDCFGGTCSNELPWHFSRESNPRSSLLFSVKNVSAFAMIHFIQDEYDKKHECSGKLHGENLTKATQSGTG